jgi:hypothetical protein
MKWLTWPRTVAAADAVGRERWCCPDAALQWADARGLLDALPRGEGESQPRGTIVTRGYLGALYGTPTARNGPGSWSRSLGSLR